MRRSLLSLLALLVVAPPLSAADGPIRVYVLAGQSNMEGKGKVTLLDSQAADPATAKEFAPLKPDGEYVVREDVWIKFLDRKGDLTVGFGSPGRIGPELGFGLTMGEAHDEQILLIKTAWGGKSLYRDFRPPSSGLPGKEVLAQLLENARKKRPETTPEQIEESFGHYYRLMIEDVKSTLANLPEHFPAAKGREVELAGIVWFQGWNDMINPDYTAEYTANMANFIRDVRKDLAAPELPFVIGVLGVGGTKEEKPNAKKDEFKKAQAAAGDLPEFEGNVAVVQTDQYWDETAQAVFSKGWKDHVEEWNKVGSDYPFHYLGSVRCYWRIGVGFGEAMRELESK